MLDDVGKRLEDEIDSCEWAEIVDEGRKSMWNAI